MFHVKRKRMFAFWLLLGLAAVIVTGCVRNTSRGWAGAVVDQNQQIVSASKGKLDGFDISPNPTPAWTGTLSAAMGQQDTQLQSVAVAPTDTPYQGDLLHIESEIVRVRSVKINGTEREMLLDRGFGGTVASAHPAGATIEAFRRAWRFPNDWHITEKKARSLTGIYGTPVLDSDGILYAGDYNGWLYAFDPAAVNLDAANDNDEPDTAIVDLGEHVIGGLALDESSSLLYVTVGNDLYAVSTAALKEAIAAGGGVIQPNSSFSFSAKDQLWGAPVIENGTVYVTSLDGNLYSLDAATGSEKWHFKASRGLATTPVIAGDLILAGGFDSTLFAVNKSDGSLAWQYTVNNWILATPALDNGVAYFGDFDGVFHAVDAQTGASEWSLPLNRGEIRAAAAVVGDNIVVGTDDGWLVGVSKTSHQRTWEVDLKTTVHADLVASGDEVLLAPDGCVTLPGGSVKTYYRAVNPADGTLIRVEGLC
jgi:outer membrane protein assembly factor BamB